MSKIAICYFSYYEDIDFLNESLKSIEKLKEKYNEHEIRVYVFDDGRYSKSIKRKNLYSTPTLITTHFNRNGNLNGFECIYGMFMEYIKLSKKFDYDYLIKLDSDCILNSLDYIFAIENRLKKQNMFNDLAQIGTYFANLCCYGCCQTFTKVGISTIFNLCSHMYIANTEESRILRKRVEKGWNEDKVVSILLEMSPVLRVSIESVEGVKGHINAFDFIEEDWIQYTSVAFKPNRYGEQKWSREKSLEEMRSYASASTLTLPNPLQDYLWGKTVAVIGNGTVDKDYSEEIDSADIVIRLNNFYNYQSGKVGKRVDALVISNLCACMQASPNGSPTQDDIISKYLPKVFIATETENQVLNNIHPRYDRCEKNKLQNKASDLRYTTGTILLKMLSEMDNINVKLYGFDMDNNWNNYLNTYAKHHLNACGSIEEENLRLTIFNKLND